MKDVEACAFRLKNTRVFEYRCKMAKTKHWSDGVSHEPVTITHDGKEYSGYYQAGQGMVRVTYDFDVKTTQSTHPHVTARILLHELVKASLQRADE